MHLHILWKKYGLVIKVATLSMSKYLPSVLYSHKSIKWDSFKIIMLLIRLTMIFPSFHLYMLLKLFSYHFIMMSIPQLYHNLRIKDIKLWLVNLLYPIYLEFKYHKIQFVTNVKKYQTQNFLVRLLLIFRF